MTNDNYITFRLYIPIGIMILLMIMLFFHRYHMLKYLYIVNLFCMFLAVSTYFIFIKQPVGYNRTWMQATPFIWLFGIFGGYSLSILSIVAFVIEHAQRHLWARVMIGLACSIFFLLCVRWCYLLIQGILSLKSG